MQDFSFYFGLGWHHILSLDALDHILFIIALAAIYILSDWKQVLVLVTAFTVGHSITLALSVFDIIRFQAKWVEFLIPCTIVVTALSNLFQNGRNAGPLRLNYYLALFFGLIHGMGFANAIRFILAEDQHLGISLFAFNVGLEAGQVLVVFVLLVIALIFINYFKVNRREWIIFLSAGVFSLAFKMALERIPIK
jgi:hypothetical protein